MTTRVLQLSESAWGLLDKVRAELRTTPHSPTRSARGFGGYNELVRVGCFIEMADGTIVTDLGWAVERPFSVDEVGPAVDLFTRLAARWGAFDSLPWPPDAPREKALVMAEGWVRPLEGDDVEMTETGRKASQRPDYMRQKLVARVNTGVAPELQPQERSKIVWERDPEPTKRATKKKSSAKKDLLRAVLFLDVKGFSGLEEKKLKHFVGKVLKRMKPILKKYKGTCSNTWGDAVVSVFPTTQQAALAALDIRDMLRKPDKVLGLLNCRCAINTRDVQVLKNPITGRNDVFGKGVTMAARLEPHVEPGYVYSLTECEGEGLACFELRDIVLSKTNGKKVSPLVVVRDDEKDPRAEITRACGGDKGTTATRVEPAQPVSPYRHESAHAELELIRWFEDQATRNPDTLLEAEWSTLDDNLELTGGSAELLLPGLLRQRRILYELRAGAIIVHLPDPSKGWTPRSGGLLEGESARVVLRGRLQNLANATPTGRVVTLKYAALDAELGLQPGSATKYVTGLVDGLVGLVVLEDSPDAVLIEAVVPF